MDWRNSMEKVLTKDDFVSLFEKRQELRIAKERTAEKSSILNNTSYDEDKKNGTW